MILRGFKNKFLIIRGFNSFFIEAWHEIVRFSVMITRAFKSNLGG